MKHLFLKRSLNSITPSYTRHLVDCFWLKKDQIHIRKLLKNFQLEYSKSVKNSALKAFTYVAVTITWVNFSDKNKEIQ